MAESRFLPTATTTKKGIVSILAQSFAGIKTFSDGLISSKRIVSGHVSLTDGATPALDASLGDIFSLVSSQNPTIAVPTNPTNAQKIIIIFRAVSAPRTLSLNTDAGGFSFGSDVTALSATPASTQDAIAAVYTTTGSLNKWMVVGYIKGFS